MQTGAIQQQILDLPPSFKPGDATWQACMNSFLMAMDTQGSSTDALAQQLSFTTSSGKWLTLWGLLFGLPRLSGESDESYSLRIQDTLLGHASTVAGIGSWIENVFNTNVSITENIPSQPGYTITFATPLTLEAYTGIANNLSRIRPAGVPFLPFHISSSGAYLDTLIFLGMGSAPGAYLGSGLSSLSPTVGLTTNAWIGTLPANYFNIPTSFDT